MFSPLLSSTEANFRLFDVEKLGVTTYVLAMGYFIMACVAFTRLSKIRLFTKKWTTQKVFHYFLFSHLVVRSIAFTVLAFFSAFDADVWYPALVMLFTLPEFVALTTFTLLFWHWLSIYIFSHHQYIFLSKERLSKTGRWLFISTSALLYLFAGGMYIALGLTRPDDEDSTSELVEYVAAGACFIIPVAAVCTGVYIGYCKLAGFPFRSEVATERIARITRIFQWWTMGRIVRGIGMIVTIRFNWEQDLDSTYWSLIIILQLMLAEFIPIIFVLDWSAVNVLLLGEEVYSSMHTSLMSGNNLFAFGKNQPGGLLQADADAKEGGGGTETIVDLTDVDGLAFCPDTGAAMGPQSANARSGDVDFFALPVHMDAMDCDYLDTDLFAKSYVNHFTFQLSQLQFSTLSSQGGCPRAGFVLRDTGLWATTRAYFKAECTCRRAPLAPRSESGFSTEEHKDISDDEENEDDLPSNLPCLKHSPLNVGGIGVPVCVKAFRLRLFSVGAVDQLTSEMVLLETNHDHPGIVKLYGVCVVPKTQVLYRVTEWVPRQSLHTLLSSSGAMMPNRQVGESAGAIDSHQRFPLSFILRVSRELAHILLYLHTVRKRCHGYVHRHNVMFDEYMSVKLSDCGVKGVKAFAEVLLVQTMSTRWSSPEALQRGAAASAAGDIYSFGLVLYELITRNISFPSCANKRQVLRYMRKHKQCDMQWPAEFDGEPKGYTPPPESTASVDAKTDAASPDTTRPLTLEDVGTEVKRGNSINGESTTKESTSLQPKPQGKALYVQRELRSIVEQCCTFTASERPNITAVYNSLVYLENIVRAQGGDSIDPAYDSNATYGTGFLPIGGASADNHFASTRVITHGSQSGFSGDSSSRTGSSMSRTGTSGMSSCDSDCSHTHSRSHFSQSDSFHSHSLNSRPARSARGPRKSKNGESAHIVTPTSGGYGSTDRRTAPK